jgi:hypothetical protein
MSLAEDIFLGRLVWADLTAAQKRDAVHDQLAEGRTVDEAAGLLSVIYGPIGANAVRGVISRHGLDEDLQVIEARRIRAADELRARSARQRRQRPVLLPRPEPLPQMPAVRLGDARKKKGITLLDLKAWHCRMPTWDKNADGLDNKFYCGNRAEEGRSYCAGCLERTTISRAERRRSQESALLAFPKKGRFRRWK